MKAHLIILVMVVVVLLAVPVPAKAYLDPTTGSMVLQIAIGGFLATLATVRIYWKRLKGLFGHRTAPESAVDNTSAPPQ